MLAERGGGGGQRLEDFTHFGYAQAVVQLRVLWATYIDRRAIDPSAVA